MSIAAASPKHYSELSALCRDIASLTAIGSLIGWDQETYMPPAGAEGRSDQQALLSGITHERKTSKRFGELLAACEADASLTQPGTIEAANIRELRRDYDLSTKLPTSLVSELAKTTSQAQEAWKHARATNDFPAFAPHLSEVLRLTRQKAECYGIPSFDGPAGPKSRKGELYDALLNEYEPGISAADIQQIFTPLQSRLSAFVAQITGSPVKLSAACAQINATTDQQQALALDVIKAVGFDLQAGRLDKTAHPFCSGIGPGDTRLTTRYTSPSFLEPLSSTLHEAGHGLYEQGLPKAQHFGLPSADAVSLGIHESQSRMWENFVGRSREFCEYLVPLAKKHFGPAAANFTADDLFKASNTIRRSFIRVESDEATYNLHIMLRFGIERELISGQMTVADLPAEWNKRFKALLGLDVPDNAQGCLQDVHWSFGLVGYFPTYTLGNLYAAQIWETINTKIPDLHARIAKGDFAPLLAFLRENIHHHGRRYSATELCQRITGKPLTADPLMRYLEGKLKPLYQI